MKKIKELLLLLALAITFYLPYSMLMHTKLLPNMEAMQKKNGGEGQKIRYDVEKMRKGSYCTARYSRIDGVSLYQNPGDPQPFYLLPEGKYVALVDNASVDGVDWGQVSYCGIEGWLPMKELTFLTEEAVYIQEGSMVYVNSDTQFGISTYAEPSSNGEKVKEGLKYGEEFVIEELKNGWGHVRTPDGQDMGWMNLYHVGSYGSQLWKIILFGQAEGLNLREEPGADSKRIIKIPDGETLTILEFHRGWGRVEYEGLEGWVMLLYMNPAPLMQ